MQRYPVVIVGGGIIGVLTARELLRSDKSTRILIVDQSMVGHGASLYSAGVHFPRGATDRVRSMSAYSHTYYLDLLASMDVPVYPIGMNVICTSARRSTVESHYLPVCRLQEAKTASLSPENVLVPEGHMVYHADGANYADVYGLLGLLLKEMGDRIELVEGARVEEVTHSRTSLLKLSTGRLIEAGKLILAPGPWIHAQPWARQIFGLGVRVKRVVAAHICMPVAPTDGLVVFDEDDAFLLPLSQRGHWLFSYTCNEWDVEPGTVGHSLTAQDMIDARKILAKYSPDLSARMDGGRAFCDAYSANREPIVAQINPQLIFAGAANGSGYRLGPAIAAQVLAQI